MQEGAATSKDKGDYPVMEGRTWMRFRPLWRESGCSPLELKHRRNPCWEPEKLPEFFSSHRREVKKLLSPLGERA